MMGFVEPFRGQMYLKQLIASVLTAVAVAGCNVVPPLDCIMGVERPGCHRDANGIYHYLYTSPLLPAPNADAMPVGFADPSLISPAFVTVPPPASMPTSTTCLQNGSMVKCTTF